MTSKILTLSTAHISEATANLWNTEGNKNSDIVARIEYGYYMYAYECANELELPSEVVEVCKYANEKCISHILFDYDGDIIEGLKTFDW